MDDPNNWAWKVASNWRVLHKLPVARRLECGRQVKSSHLIIRRGDFVDVGITFGIVRRNRHRVDVQLEITHVCQLLPCTRVKEVGVMFMSSHYDNH